MTPRPIRTRLLLVVVAVLSQTAAADAALVGYWPLNGNALDVSGYGNNGTLPGSEVFDTGFDGTPNGAIHLPGLQLSIPASSSLNISGELSMSAWIRPNDLSEPWEIIRKYNHGDVASFEFARYHYNAANNDDLLFNAYHSGFDSEFGWRFVSNGPLTLHADQWTHIAVVFRPSESISLYMNGTPLTGTYSGTVVDSLFTSQEPISFVAFDGLLDDVRIYNEALSAVRIATLAGQWHGDYNFDGVVDASDYVAWRAMSGQSGFDLAADGDLDGDVDQDDYNVWRAHFGETVLPSAASASAGEVPEPCGLALFAVAAPFFFLRRIEDRIRIRVLARVEFAPYAGVILSCRRA